MIDPAQIVGTGEISAMAGVTKGAVSNWIKRRADFPRPIATVGASEKRPTKLFDCREIEDWLASHHVDVATRAWKRAVVQNKTTKSLGEWIELGGKA